MRFYERWPVLSSALLGTVLFGALALPFCFTLLADDYEHQLATIRGELQLESLANYLSRVPVLGLFTRAIFTLPVWGSTWPLLFVFFFVHAAALAQLLAYVSGSDRSAPRRFIVIAALLSLYPTFYEVLYWPTCMPYVVGAGFLALALRSSAAWVRIPLFVLAALTSEMFVLPALFAPIVRQVIALAPGTSVLRIDWRSLARDTVVWAIALALILLLRWLLASRFGHYTYDLRFEPLHVLIQMREALMLLFGVHFHGLNWTLTVLAVVLCGIAAAVAIRGKGVAGKGVLLALVLVYIATFNYWILGYHAPRALYGPGLLFLAVLGRVLLAFLDAASSRRFALAVPVLLAGVYVGHSLSIFVTKNQNAARLERHSAQLAQRMESCVSPCVIDSAPPNDGLVKDWVLPPDYWRAYFDIQKVRHGRGKAITIRVGSVSY